MKVAEKLGRRDGFDLQLRKKRRKKHTTQMSQKQKEICVDNKNRGMKSEKRGGLKQQQDFVLQLATEK